MSQCRSIDLTHRCAVAHKIVQLGYGVFDVVAP